MRRSNYTTQGQDGTTVVEVLVVVVIISVVAAFAIMNKGTANEQFQRQNVARELKFAFERARFDSVKRHAEGGPAEVLVETDKFTLRTDSDLSISGLESAETLLPPNISIARFDGGTGDVTVAFDKRGEIGPTSPAFLVCNGTCTAANDTPGNANIVLVTPTGTVNMLPGGATPPSFTAPSVAPPVGAGTDVNPRALLPSP